MRTPLSTLTIVAALLTSATADPAEDLAAGAKELAAAKNYTWSSSMAWGDREARTTTAKKGSGGHTHLVIPMRDSSVEVLIRNGRAVVKTDAGWQLADPDAEGDENRRLRWMGRMAARYEEPTDRINELIEGMAEVKVQDGVHSAALTEEAAKGMMTFRRGRGRGDEQREPPAIQGAAGMVKFTLKDGVIAKYELSLSGSMSFNGEEREISRTSTVEFTDVGSTSFDIPEEAAGLLAGESGSSGS